MKTSAVVAIEFSQGIEDAWSDIATFVPKLIGFLVVLFLGWIVAKIIRRVVNRVLDQARFDSIVERTGLTGGLARSETNPSDLLSKLIYYAVLLVVLDVAFGVFGENAVSDLIHATIAYLPKVFAALLIVVVAALIAGAVRDLVHSSLGDVGTGKLLGTIAYAAILVFGGFAALNQLAIAQDIVNGVFYALLAVVAGSAIVAIGGGGIQPMRQRWERALQSYDEEKPKLQRAMQERSAARTDVVESEGEWDVATSQERTGHTTNY